VGSVGLDSDFIGLYVGNDKANTSSIKTLVDMLEREEFDMVAVGRALLSDPEWVLKVKEGREEEIVGFTKEYVEKYF
jgi:2,4-dienoyl-CoA reductase-like NADH-dependent reductase (Old Yellow Enzyme family)